MKYKYRLQGLDCADCAAKIERDIAKLPGTSEVSVNFLTCRLTLEAEEDLSATITKIVHKYEPDVKIK